MSDLFASVREACAAAMAGRLAAGEDRAVVQDALEAEMPDVLHHLLRRVYVTEFHRFREAHGLPVDATSTVAHDRFTAQLSGATVAGWFEAYPVLRRLITTIVTRRVDELRRVATAAREALADGSLVRAGILAPGHGPVGQIRSLDSDLHNGARRVCVVTLTSGEAFVYKPRPLAVDRLAADVLAEVADASGIDVRGVVPAVVDCGDHGWQAFVRPRPLDGPEAARAYFERLGAAAAVLGVLGAVDMHHENVVACGDTPVLIDLETVLQPERSIPETHLPGRLLGARGRSVANTMLLPNRLPSGPYSVLMGGIGVPSEQVSDREDFVLVDAGTDAVDIARRRFPYRHTDNIPVDADGVAYSALDCADEFLAGFERGHRACERRRDALLERLREPVPVRFIVRSTAIYYRFLWAATHPDHLADEAEFRRILGLLGTPAGLEGRPEATFIAEQEVAALADGDIPYFSIAGDELRIQAADGRRSTPMFDHSPADRAALGLAEADGTALPRTLVETGLDELGGALDRPVRLARHTFGAALTGDGASWRTVAERLRELAVRVDAPAGEQAGWLSAGNGEQTSTFDAGPAISLYDLGGIDVLFERIEARMPADAEPGFAAAARRGTDRLELAWRDALDLSLPSVLGGPASLAFKRSADAPRSPEAEALAERALRAETGEDPGDLLKGVAGHGLLLAGFPDTPTDLLARLLDRTRAALNAGRLTREPHNLAHGELGLLWALHRLGGRCGDEAAVAEATERYEAVVAAAGDAPRGWCNGAAGLTLVGAELLDAGDERVAAQAERAAEVGAGRVDVSVCHGVGGTVQTLVHLARRTGERWPLELAREHVRDAGAAAATHGFYTGVANRTTLPGYFLGWSGFADSVLALELEEHGEAPWLPVAFGPAVAAVPA